MKSLRNAAIEYANSGWAVFPLVPNNKIPLIPKDEAKAKAKGWPAGGHGCKDATLDITQVDEWWSKCPSANIGIATGPASGLLIVDIDSPEAGYRYRQMGELGKPIIQNTKDGYHLGYAWTMECDGISISAGKLGNGIDTRGEGGYIVGAPSVHPSGFIYHWRESFDPSPPPRWLIAKLKPKPIQPSELDRALFARIPDAGVASKYGNAALKNTCERIASAPDGVQELTLHRGAFSIGRLVAGGEISASYAAMLLQSAAMSMGSSGNKKPWSHDELEKKVRVSMERGAEYPRHAESRQ